MITIKRAPRRRRFAVISSEAIEDRRLSFKARGVLCYVLSKPDDWQIRTAELMNASDADGRDAIRSALRELREKRYLVLEKKQDAAGRFCTSYIVHEEPTGDGKTVDGFSGVGFPVPLLSTDLPNNDHYTSIMINDKINVTKILKENGGEVGDRLAELAEAVRSSTWDRMFDRYGDADFFAATLAKLARYYAEKPAKAKKLKSLSQLLNNWLKKEWIDPTVAAYRAAYLDMVKEAAGVPYDFNNNSKGTDMIGIKALIKQIEANSGVLSSLLGTDTGGDIISLYKAFLNAAPDFWKKQRPAALSRGFTSICADIKKSKSQRPAAAKSGGYADFDFNDIENIL